MKAEETICEQTGKKRFPSPESAEKRRKELKQRHGEKLSVYRCTRCKDWHLGHPIP